MPKEWKTIMVMVILQNGLNQTWNWSKLSNLVLIPKNFNDVTAENDLLRIKNLLANRTSSYKIYLNTENYDVLRSLEKQVSHKKRKRLKQPHSSHVQSFHKLSSIEMILKMMSSRDRRNSSRWLSKLGKRAFLHSFDPLKSFSVINGTKTPIRYILLVSHFRAGSSFVGDLLQQNWKTFYSFEPLHLFQINYKVDPDQDEEALSLLQNIYSCSFASEPGYVEWIRKRENKFLLTWNRFLWSLCNIYRSWCYDPNFIHQLCLRTKYRVIKVTRLSLKSAAKLLNQLPKSIDLKLLYLVRDPRAIYNSRSKLEWCTKTPCGDYNLMCDDFESDLAVYKQLVDTYGDKIISLRHEDLSLNPYEKGATLFKSLGLPFTSGVRRFLRINTEAELPTNITIDPYSIRRSSKKVITKWTKELNASQIIAIQNRCPNVFDQLGYKPIDLSYLNVSSINFEDILEEKLTLPNSL
uniref:Uncharacterized protein n=1 Tax=Tetranychus urticae TaxID=32264 RepID=T1L1R3_TETUR